jgi:predicted phosphodiesterase
LFQVVREFLLECKAAGGTLITMDELRQETGQRLPERAATQAELDTVVQLLQSRGLVHRLDPRSGVTWILLKPERINQYGGSIIQAARNHPQGIGAVPERDVLTGSLAFAGFVRLPQAEEPFVLEATAELIIRHDLCFREMGYLVFPSQINVTRLPPTEAHPRTEVAYRFSGGIETIYASLVVRLSYTDYFRREDQWKYAVEFSRDNHRLGFYMQQVEEGTGELEIYFYRGISEFDRVTFIRFVTDHLRVKGIDIQEQIRLYCPKCSKEVTNREAIETRIQEGYLDIPCQYCATTILIPKSIEERYRQDPSLGEKQQQLVETAEKRTQAEVMQFRADQQQYSGAEERGIHILHLSDLHLESETQAQVYRTQLETDLIQELGIRRLEYLVISGDIANHATEEEYRAAFAMLDGLVKRFGLDPNRIVIVPGNHDLNWGLSKKAYPFVYRDDLSTPLPEGRYIPAGDAGALLRDDLLYCERFTHFNTHLYRRVYPSQDYPVEYADQVAWVERPEDRILFLGLNSCWEIDHHFRDRASIHVPALTRALDHLQDGTYDGWLKLAVWHHPVAGKEMINDEFMQLLEVHGFQVCLHGHIHEAIEGFHKYDDRRGIHIIGAGTFGAPARQQVTGIPLQYNLLTFDPQKGEITVQTRKKEKPNGAWSADTRWGDKNDPKPQYKFQVQHYQMH